MKAVHHRYKFLCQEFSEQYVPSEEPFYHFTLANHGSIKLSPDRPDVLYLAHCAKVLGAPQHLDMDSHYQDNMWLGHKGEVSSGPAWQIYFQYFKESGFC